MSATSVLVETLEKAHMDTDEFRAALIDVIEMLISQVTKVHFPVASYAPTAGLLTQDIVIEVADTNSIRNRFGENLLSEVQVQRNSGSAAGPSLTGAEGQTGTSIRVKLVKGRAVVTVAASGTGTVVVGLTDLHSTGLTMSDTVTVTFS